LTRPLSFGHGGAGFPEAAACPESAELLERWESLLEKTPRLRAWVGEMLGERRVKLLAKLDGQSPLVIERTLWQDLARWLREFEELPPFAISAIATTLESGDTIHDSPSAVPGAVRHELRMVSPHLAEAECQSPERAACEREALFADAAFALAFHCVEVRLRPRLSSALAAAPSLSRVPEAAWFGLLHSTAPACALLTPEVAVSLVLRTLSVDWMTVPAEARRSALRFFGARPSDLRGAALDRLCRALPPAWEVAAHSAPDFVEVAGEARLGLADAVRLCNRIAGSITSEGRGGGLAVIEVRATGPAGPEELEELSETARKYAGMAGFRRLLELLP